MLIGVTGATGFIGSRVLALARERGHAVIGYSRKAGRSIDGTIETREYSDHRPINVDGCDAIIHLAGESVMGIWTGAKRRRIRDSRVLGTRNLVESILRNPQPPRPRVLVSSSGIAIYGNTGDTPADEDSPPGSGFLAGVAREWEAEALRAREAGTRVVLLRTSMVLGRGGGALGAMLPFFRTGLGARISSGQQWMSWIHLDDEAALALFAAENAEVEGALNATAPEPVRNAVFTRELAAALHRPAFLAAPGFVLRAVTGEFSHELLDSKRILPKRAETHGFRFRFPKVHAALADLV